MPISLKQYKEYSEDKDYFQAWEDILNEMGAKKVLFCEITYYGYGGSIDFDILLEDGKIISYSYGFDSCCDRLTCACTKEIDEDIRQESTFFDNMKQYNAWVDTLPDNNVFCKERKAAKLQRRINKGELKND